MAADVLDDRSLNRATMERQLLLQRSSMAPSAAVEHLVAADDAFTWRPLVQPVLDAEIARHSEFARHLLGVDMAAVLAFARPLLADRPTTSRQRPDSDTPAPVRVLPT